MNLECMKLTKWWKNKRYNTKRKNIGGVEKMIRILKELVVEESDAHSFVIIHILAYKAIYDIGEKEWSLGKKFFD